MAPRWILGAIIISSLATGTAAILYLISRYRRGKDVDEGYSETGADEPLPRKVLVLGLDGSGKSTLLQALSDQLDSQQTSPTDGFNVITVHTGDQAKLDIWEIGGGLTVRKHWPRFVEDVAVLVFVVDASDRDRFSEAYTEMHKLLGEPRLLEIPFIVVANKQDVSGAADPAEIKEALGLEDVKHHRVRVLPASLSPSSVLGLQQLKDSLSRT